MVIATAFLKLGVEEEIERATERGDGRLVAVFQAGGHFGHESFSTKKKSLAYFRAAANSDVLIFPKDDMEHLLVDSPHVFDELSTDGVKLYDNIKAVVDIHTHIESIPPGPVDPKIMPELKVVLNGELRDFGHKKRTLSYAKMQSTKTLCKDLDPYGD